jgi:hypothetical protein
VIELIRLHPERRGADRLQAALDEQVPPEELADQVTAARMLASLCPARPRHELDPEFRNGLRAMLIAAGDEERRRADVRPPLPITPRRPFLAMPQVRMLTATVLTAVAATAFVSLRSQGALPGDSLYDVKRGQELAHLAMASGGDRGELLLSMAHTRLQEAYAIQQAGKQPIDGVLVQMRETTVEGVRLVLSDAVAHQELGRLNRVAEFVGVQREQMGHLIAAVQQGSPVAIATDYLGLLQSIDQRVTSLRDTISCDPADADDLGPVPGSCDTASDPSRVPRPDDPAVPPILTVTPAPGQTSSGGSGPAPFPPVIPIPVDQTPAAPLPPKKPKPSTATVEPTEPTEPPIGDDGGVVGEVLGGVGEVLDGIGDLLGGNDESPTSEAPTQ